MSLQLAAVAIALAGLLVTLALIIARASSRLAVVETRTADLADEVKRLREQFTVRDQLTVEVKQLREAWQSSLSAPRARHSRESEEIPQ